MGINTLYPLDTPCAGCGEPCRNGLRWCSNACFYMEDGYPDDDCEQENDND